MSDALSHFTQRASYYDRSSRWCTDPVLGQQSFAALAPEAHHRVLDVACGTGLVSRLFKGRVAEVVGLDLTPAMAAQAAPHLDRLEIGSAEAMPFADATFDRVICRQGTQFMNDRAAVAEMFRVLKPGGRVLLIHLCAWGSEDREEYFEILRLRNPARRNFYLREDLLALLNGAGFSGTQVTDYVSEEDVEAWADNQAVTSEAVEAIRQVYLKASPEFLRLHGVRMEGDRIVDRMLFGLASGTK